MLCQCLIFDSCLIESDYRGGGSAATSWAVVHPHVSATLPGPTGVITIDGVPSTSTTITQTTINKTLDIQFEYDTSVR